jgi:hypothetical protein
MSFERAATLWTWVCRAQSAHGSRGQRNHRLGPLRPKRKTEPVCNGPPLPLPPQPMSQFLGGPSGRERNTVLGQRLGTLRLESGVLGSVMWNDDIYGALSVGQGLAEPFTVSSFDLPNNPLELLSTLTDNSVGWEAVPLLSVTHFVTDWGLNPRIRLQRLLYFFLPSPGPISSSGKLRFGVGVGQGLWPEGSSRSFTARMLWLGGLCLSCVHRSCTNAEWCSFPMQS